MSGGNRKIDVLTKVVSDSTEKRGSEWPLKYEQLFPYFAVDQLMFFYDKMSKYRDNGGTVLDAAKVIKHPSVVRNFISNIALFEDKRIDSKKRNEVLSWLIEVLEMLVPGDPFCQKKGNKVLSEGELSRLAEEIPWTGADIVTKKVVNHLITYLKNLCWGFYWTFFPSAGYEAYGPCSVSAKGFTKKGFLVVHDFYNVKPVEIWDTAERMNIRSVKLFLLYKTDDIDFDFDNRISGTDHLSMQMEAVGVFVDGKLEGDVLSLNSLIDKIAKVGKEQIDLVNGLSDVDKVRYGARLSVYPWKDFYLSCGDSWYDEKAVEKVIEEEGEKLMEGGK